MLDLFVSSPGRSFPGVYRLKTPAHPAHRALLLFATLWLALAAPLAPGAAAQDEGGAGFRAPPRTEGQKRRSLQARTPLVHLTIQDSSGRYRRKEHVTHGVPFREGRLADVEDLRVWRADDGRRLPGQFRVLSRWPDDSQKRNSKRS